MYVYTYLYLHPYESFDPPIEVFDSIFLQRSLRSQNHQWLEIPWFLRYLYVYIYNDHRLEIPSMILKVYLYLYIYITTIDLKSHQWFLRYICIYIYNDHRLEIPSMILKVYNILILHNIAWYTHDTYTCPHSKSQVDPFWPISSFVVTSLSSTPWAGTHLAGLNALGSAP